MVYVNLMVTMFLGGLWHGASWNFVLWGGMHGLALCIHRGWKGISGNMPVFLGWILTFLFVLLAWVPFRCADFGHSMMYFSGLLTGDGIYWMMPQVVMLLLLVMVTHGVMAWKSHWIGLWHVVLPVSERAKSLHFMAWFWLVMALLVWAPVNSSPFIYFQF